MSKSEQPVKVGYILRKFPVLSETFILNEILALEERGVQVHIFSLCRTSDPRFHDGLVKLKARISYIPDITDPKKIWNVHRKYIKNKRKLYFKQLAKSALSGHPNFMWRYIQSVCVAREAKRLGITHFHAHFADNSATVASYASNLTGIPFSFSAHAVDIFKKVTPKELTKKVSDASFVVAISEYNKQYLQEVTKQEPDKIVRVYNGINLNRYQPPKVLNLKNTFTILAVARLVEKKGLDVLIKACHRLKEQGMSFQCLIVGKGAMKAKLLELISNLELENHVYMLGAKTQLEVLELYHQVHLFVLPSIIASDGNREGLPVSITEALACGLPVVTTPCTGITEAVHDRHNGLIVPCNDDQALSDAIKVMYEDKTLYNKIKSNAHASVKSQFNQDHTTTQLKSLFAGSY